MRVVKIHQKTEKMVLDLEDFIALKEVLPFMEFRFLAKKINFGFLFGMIGSTFSDRELTKIWSEAQIDSYILENNIATGVIDQIEIQYKFEKPKKECKYIAVSEDIRRKFFDKYTGLEQRITDMRKFFTDNGYVRSYYGAFRKNSLVLMGGNEDDKKELAGLNNIVVNTTIQNFEAVVVMRNIVRISRWFRENKMKSRVFGTVHDSVDFYLEISEIDIVVPKIIEIFEEMFEEFNEVPLTIDMKIGEHYKEGVNIK